MAAWASYQIAFLAEVVPTPKAYLFFALFNTVGKTSGFVGPFVSSGITTRAGGNTNMSFIFLFSMGLVGFIVLLFVDPDKAKLDNIACKPCQRPILAVIWADILKTLSGKPRSSTVTLRGRKPPRRMRWSCTLERPGSREVCLRSGRRRRAD
jgi:hypothetical protein